MKTKNKKQKHNSISFNRNKSNLTSGNLIKKELKGIKQYIYDYSIRNLRILELSDCVVCLHT